MGIYSWDLDSGFSTAPLVRTPRLTIRCEYPDTPLAPTEVTFRLSPSYGLTTGLLVRRRGDVLTVPPERPSGVRGF